MLRFIIKRHITDNISGLRKTLLETVDIDVPTLEKILSGGGWGENGSDSRELVGVEVLKTEGGLKS